ncbi:MAG: ASCH domain-containing protein [Alphaproteobacteria bacterium]|nr:ASCH domain-containing protein [Alphaproteobacteria bacterium]MBO7642507.1 ASCH domain-containing protein [Alphaproteobacteria bacterium]
MGINNINIYPKAKYNLSMINTADRPYLNWLTSGVKKAEGRVNSPRYRSMQVGDTILFCDRKTGYYIFGKVKFKHEYNSFEEMLKAEGVSNMLPFLEDHELAEGVDVYNAFPRASRVHEFGCVAIGITVLKFNLRPITSIS